MAYSPIFGTPQVQPGMLGLNPASRRQQQVQGVGDLLTSLGIGLMGQGPSRTPQGPLSGLGQGLALNGQMQQQRQAQQSNDLRDQLAQGQYGMEADKYNTDKMLADEQQKQRDEAIKTLPPEYQKYGNDPEFWKAYYDHLYKNQDTSPKIQTFRRGNQDVSGYWDQNGKFVEMSSGDAFAPKQENVEFGLQPFITKGGDGKLHAFQLSKNGGMQEIPVPDGQQVTQPITMFDTGTAGVPIGKLSGPSPQGVPSVPKDVAGQAAQGETGTATGKAQVNLPAVQQNADLIIKTIESLKTDPGREAATGLSSIFNPLALPGSDRKNFLVKQEQLKGQAFLNAYDGLRSSGAITDVEGEKATAAKARLDTAQSEGEYLKALDDFESAIKDLTVIAQRKAQGNFQPLPSSNVPPPPPGFQVVK